MLDAIFEVEQRWAPYFSRIFRDFAHIFRDFSRIIKDFAQIFNKSKFLGAHLHPVHARLLHH